LLAATFREELEPMYDDRQRETGLEVLCLADVTPKPIDWLWPNWLARGKVHMLAGEGGRGKSTILCDIASRATRGEPWPDGSANAGCGSVIILSAEDDPEDTLAPRLLAVGADMERISVVRAARDPDRTRRAFNLQTDLARLEVLIREKGDVSLIILDPVSSYLGKVDSHKNAEVRTVLEPLGDLAARLHVAVICNNHFSKGGGNANNRIIGSVAFVNHLVSGVFPVRTSVPVPVRTSVLFPVRTSVLFPRPHECPVSHQCPLVGRPAMCRRPR
jgi:putative DNA primase/helicase